MQEQSFLEEIKNSVLVGDGATGTELFARGAGQDKGIERLNLIAPELVLGLHKDYVAAGSRVIETNTFGANRINLARYGAESEVGRIIQAGVSLARSAAGGGVYVAGSVGPLPTVEGEPIAEQEASACFAEQISALLESGVDLLILESFTNFKDAAAALGIARSMTSLPIVAQMAFDTDGYTADGFSADDAALRCRDAGADIVGANCGYGVTSVIAAIRRMSRLGLPMSAYMNAGFPEQVEGRLVYLSSPGYLADRARLLVGMGVRLIGGCCGTGPDTIRALKEAVRNMDGLSPIAHVKESLPRGAAQTVSANPLPPGRILVELDPPTSLNVEPVIAAAKTLKKAGASAITIADNPLASVRVDTLTVSAMVQQKANIPVIPHLTGRDRNRIAVQSTIMGAHVLGIRSILCVTGDPVRMCEEPNTSGVFDVNSVGLVRLVAAFNAGQRMGRDCQTAFSIGVALNPNVRSISGQMVKLRKKVDAGAHFALTQPVFSIERLDMLERAMEDAGVSIPVYVGILPLTSIRNADFLHNEVPGMHIPDDVRATLARYQSVADQRAAGVEIAAQMIKKFARRVHGFYIITPRNRADVVAPLISAAV